MEKTGCTHSTEGNLGAQLGLFADPREDPATCPHRCGMLWGRSMCDLTGQRVVTGCGESHFGEPPRCSYLPCDNSTEAMARRVAWAAENEVREKEERI